MGGEPNPGGVDARRLWTALASWRYRFWLALAVLVAISFSVTLELSLLRWTAFGGRTWDLGIFQQGLWSTTQGSVFWEAADYEFAGVHSFLQVHPSPILFGLVPLYAYAPSAATLFIVQAALVAVAAFPLAALARRTTGSAAVGMVAAVLYLVQASILSSALYDFHLEAFFPVEMFLLVFLWETRRYILVVPVAILTMVTLEAGPVLVFFVALFFLWPDLVRFEKALLSPDGAGPTSSARARLRRFRAGSDWRAIAFGTAFLIGAVLAYAILRIFQYDVMSGLVGGSQIGEAAGTLLPGGVGVALGNLESGFVGKITYWVLVFAMAAFLPFRAPRTLVLILPWFAFTVLSANLAFSTLGYQYGFVAAATVLTGAAYGLRGIRFRRDARVERGWAASSSPADRPSWVRRLRRAAQPTGWTWMFLVVVALNLVLSPVNPAMQASPPGPGYWLAYNPPPGFSQVTALASLLPGNASVLATPTMFPFVANDVNAYSMLWYAQDPPFLPFNATELPPYVLISQNELSVIPLWLGGQLYSKFYGVRGVVWQSPVGSVFLFELGYNRTFESWLPLPKVPTYYWGHGLDVGPAARVVGASDAPFPQVIETDPRIPNVAWFGPYTSLEPGNYTVTLLLTAVPAGGGLATSPGEPILRIQFGSFGYGNWLDATYPLSQLDTGGPVTLTIPFRLTVPVTNVEYRGFQVGTGVVMTLYYVLVTPQ